jgi:hypothetical protein
MIISEVILPSVQTAFYSGSSLFRERQFGKKLRAVEAVKLSSLSLVRVANIAANQNALSGVLSSDTHGNFLPEMHELVIRDGPPLVAELG